MNTTTRRTRINPKISAAASGAAQIDWLECELKEEPIPIGSHDFQSKPTTVQWLPAMVNMCLFEVHLKRLTNEEIQWHTTRTTLSQPRQPRQTVHTSSSSTPSRSSPVVTQSLTLSKRQVKCKQKTISGHPSKHLVIQKPSFKVRKHILHRCRYKTYLKCRVKGCPLPL